MADVYVINKTSIDVTKLSIESFIENYGPKVSTPDGVAPKYQYNEESQELLKWENGEQSPLRIQIDKEMALISMFAQALFEVENHPDNDILVFVSKQEALSFVESSIGDTAEETEKLTHLRNTLAQM